MKKKWSKSQMMTERGQKATFSKRSLSRFFCKES